jgi:hypothetical protein
MIADSKQCINNNMRIRQCYLNHFGEAGEIICN